MTNDNTLSGLIEGRWYALMDDEDNLYSGPLAQYVGEGRFVDEDEREFSAGEFQRFILQY